MNALARRLTAAGSRLVVANGGSTSYFDNTARVTLRSCHSRLLSTFTNKTTATTTTTTLTTTLSSTPPGGWEVSLRTLSTAAATTTTPASAKANATSTPNATTTTATVFTDDGSGKQYGMVLDTRKMPKLKPSIVQRRIAACKTYVGREQSIRQSPWKLNRICQLAAGLTLEEALTQLQFCHLKNADLVAKVLKRTSNLADIRDGLQISQLDVAECFATKSMMLRRSKPMGRGRHGIMHHKYSHIRVVLREIDFPLKIYQQKSLNQKKKWLMHQQRADQDGKAAKAKREEMERLLQQEQEQRAQRNNQQGGADKL